MKLKAALFSLTLSLFGTQAYAHCQIPCGIYGDMMRFDTMLEDVTTIEKSVKEITAESAKDKPNYNQLVRWVNNKETHADNIADVVLKYFLQQRIKTGQKDYEKKLIQLHAISVLAMKAKQTADLKVVGKLNAAIASFKSLYLTSAKEKAHKH